MSSEHDVRVVRVGPLTKHPNADSLSITEVDGRPVICRTGEYQEGDLAVYVPIDSVVPEGDPRWEFLAGHRRIRAKKLRGVFSMGLLAKPPESASVGDDVRDALGITVYEPPADLGVGGDNEVDPGCMPVYTDIESYRKYAKLLAPNDEVVVTEKIHGANGRFMWWNDRLWCGSRTGIKREDPKSIWWAAAKEGGLAEKLAAAQDVVVYGEVYGQVQDLKYGVGSGVRFVAFDAFSINLGGYLGFDAFDSFVVAAGIPRVPVLYRGPVSGLDAALAEGPSVLAGGACIREGFVVRPTTEPWDQECGRVILKLVGQGYHLRKSA